MQDGPISISGWSPGPAAAVSGVSEREAQSSRAHRLRARTQGVTGEADASFGELCSTECVAVVLRNHDLEVLCRSEPLGPHKEIATVPPESYIKMDRVEVGACLGRKAVKGLCSTPAPRAHLLLAGTRLNQATRKERERLCGCDRGEQQCAYAETKSFMHR